MSERKDNWDGWGLRAGECGATSTTFISEDVQRVYMQEYDKRIEKVLRGSRKTVAPSFRRRVPLPKPKPVR